MVRAGLHAGFTANTLFSVDLCNSIYHADRVKLAGICTVSHAQAAIRACPVTTIEHLGRFTGVDTIQLFDLSRCLQRTFTHNHGDLRIYISACNTHDLSDLRRYSCTAYRAERCADISIISQSLGIIRTSCESAGTAVSTRKNFFNSSNAFVHRNEHQLCCDGQDDTSDQTNCCYDYSR